MCILDEQGEETEEKFGVTTRERLVMKFFATAATLVSWVGLRPSIA